MQGGRRQNERQVMIRIIKLLFSFADMAERAAYRSILVRTFLLAIFRIAEPAARRYVLRYDGNVIKVPEPMRGDGVRGRAEALHLAWLFRLFAMMLSNLMAWREKGRIDAMAIDTQVIRRRCKTCSFRTRILRMPARASPGTRRTNLYPSIDRNQMVAGLGAYDLRQFTPPARGSAQAFPRLSAARFPATAR